MHKEKQNDSKWESVFQSQAMRMISYADTLISQTCGFLKLDYSFYRFLNVNKNLSLIYCFGEYC